MSIFSSAYRQRIDAAVQDLCASHADLLALRIEDVTAVAREHGLDGASTDLLSQLLDHAIERDVHRLTDIFQASGFTAMQPARLVADWAIGLGLSTQDVARIAAASTAPVKQAQAYLRVGRIELPQHRALEDVAVAYGAPADTALDWIAVAVDAEIDRQVDDTRSRGSWWRRPAGSQPR